MRRFLKLTAIGFGLSLAFNSTALAQQTFGAESYPYASEAQSLQAQNEHKKAIKRLKKGLKLDGLSAFEISTMYQMMGASYYARGDHEETIEAFENAINAGGLSQTDKTNLQLNVAQLNIADENYAVGAQQLEAYFRGGGVQKPKLVKMLLQAHMRTGNKAAAVPWAEAMMRQNIVQTRKDYELVIYLLDTPEKRASQMQAARKMFAQWPTDPDVLARIERLNVKAKIDGVPTISVPGS